MRPRLTRVQVKRKPASAWRNGFAIAQGILVDMEGELSSTKVYCDLGVVELDLTGFSLDVPLTAVRPDGGSALWTFRVALRPGRPTEVLTLSFDKYLTAVEAEEFKRSRGCSSCSSNSSSSNSSNSMSETSQGKTRERAST